MEKVEVDIPHESKNEIVVKTEWSQEQIAVIDLAMKGRNLFITGGGGVGKSFVTKELIRLFKETKRNFCITGSTGAAAVILDGITLHSLLGVGLATGTIDALIAAVIRNPLNASRWRKMQTLIVDEISMMDPFFFDRCDKITRVVRGREDEPFGGIQIILVGDFYQLPAINNNRDRNGDPPAIDDGILDFCFELPLWKALKMEVVHLTQVFRQADPLFASTLNRIRTADHTNADMQLLQQRQFVKLPTDDGIIPTNLWAYKANVEKENLSFLEKLEGEEKVFNHRITYLMRTGAKMSPTLRATMEKHAEMLTKRAMAPPVLKLKVGAQVMLVANQDFELGLVNGSRGVVIGFSATNQYPIVRFVGGSTIEVGPKNWPVEEANTASVNYWQIPLVLAWSLTIHKCVAENTLVSTPEGLIPIFEISPPRQSSETWAPLSNFWITDRRGNVRECNKIYKGKSTKEKCFRFMTHLGNMIECTGEHPLLVFNPETKGSDWREAKSIQLGDSLLLRFGLRCEYVPKVGEKSLSAGACYRLGQNKSSILDPGYFMLRNSEIEKSDLSLSFWRLKCVPRCILRNTIACQARFVEGVFGMPIGTIDLEQEEDVPYDDQMDRYHMIPGSIQLYKQLYALILNLGMRGGISLVQEGYGNDPVDVTLRLRLEVYPHMMVRKILVDSVRSKSEIWARTLDLHVPVGHQYVADGFCVHNCQGASLNKVSISLKGIFQPGQVYVALSRVRSLEGLSFKDAFDPYAIRVHPKVKHFYEHGYKPYMMIDPLHSKTQIVLSASQPPKTNPSATANKSEKRKKKDQNSSAAPKPKRAQTQSIKKREPETQDPTRILNQFYSTDFRIEK